MLKRIAHIYITLLAALASGCSNDIDDGIGDADAGYILPHIYVSGDDAPDVSDFSLTLSDGGSKEHTWSRADEFSPTQGFRPGRYVMTASYGNAEDEGVGMPFYSGSTSFDVTANKTTDVTVDCTRKNVAVALDVDESFSSRMSGYNVIFHSEGGGYFDYQLDAAEDLYLRHGDVEVFLHFTLVDGRAASVLMYRVAAAEGDDLSFRLSADDAAVTLDVAGREPRVLELTSELFSASAPEIEAEGFISGTPLEVVEGVQPAVPVVFKVSSSQRLSEVVFTVQPPSLLALGISRETDLLGGDEAALGLLAQYGADCTVAADRKSLTLDVTTLLTNLKAADSSVGQRNLHGFSLVAINELGQVSRPATLEVDLRPMEIEVQTPDKVEAGASTATVRVKATSGDFINHLKVYTSTDDGASWNSQAVTGCAEISQQLYDVSFRLPGSVAYPSVRVRMDYLGVQAAMFDLYFTSPAYTIAVDAFASQAVVKINGSTPQVSQAIASSAYVYVNGTPANIYMRDAANHLIYVTGLTPSATYDVTCTIFRHPENGDFTAPVRITTEDILQLPNGTFEDTDEVINWHDLPMGGRYSQNAMPLFNRQNCTDVVANQPKAPWASVNEKTFYQSSSNPNTWYMQPSTMESANIISGAVSIKLVSVAFDPAGADIEPYRQVSPPYISYNPNVPDIRYRAAGKIFLGSYAYNGGSEEYNEGYPFGSRPSAINGIYRYIPGGDSPEDCGRVDISLWGTVDGQYREIASATGKLYPSATNASFSVPIGYPIFGAKASAIKVMVSSSYDIGDIDYESRHIITSADAQTASSTGSILEVDELTLSY